MAIERLSFHSKVLAHNPLGDPYKRIVTVWTPNDYKTKAHPLPVMFAFAGFLGSGHSFENWQPFRETLSQRLDRLYESSQIGPCVVVMPDCFTSFGGNQYINSSAIGDYASYINDELIDFIEDQFYTYKNSRHRACFGKSSGGYGALSMGINYPDNWAAIACHSGDAYFDFIYRNDWPNTINELARYRPKKGKSSFEDNLGIGIDDGRIQAFLEYIKKKNKMTYGESHCLMNLAMAASYDPDPDVNIRFRVPFHLETGELISDRWEAWLSKDPVNLIHSHQASLDKLKLIYIDCGSKDQYQIHFGARQLSKKLQSYNIQHFYEEFDDNHSGIDYRLDASLPKLYKAIA
jgi:enterochelin esterase-like enzyme